MQGALQMTMLVTVAMVTTCLALLARPRPGRLYLMSVDLPAGELAARGRRMLAIVLVSGAAAAALTLLPHGGGGVSGVLLVSLVPTSWMTLEIARVRRSQPAPGKGGRFRVPLDPMPGLARYLSFPLATLNLLIPLVSALAFAVILRALPGEVPLHWDAAGRVDRSGSPRELWSLLGIMLMLGVMFTFFMWTQARQRWALPAREAERYRELEEERRENTIRLLETIWLGTNLSLATTWLSLTAANLPGWEWLRAVGLVTGVGLSSSAILVALATRLGRAMELADELKRIAGTDTLGTREDGWRWGGLVYYAPADPAVFVSKRSGMGQTINLARPGAWLLLVAIVLLPGLAAAGAWLMSRAG